MTTPKFQPLYRQIKALITDRLIAGEWVPGAPIPSEMDLAASLGVSQGTVRKAIDELASENIVVRRQGKGTFVATYSEERAKLRFLRLTASDGSAEALENRLLSCERGKATAQIARMLDVARGSSIIDISRVLSFAGTPVILDRIVLPAAPFAGVSAELINEYSGSMYRMYETRMGISMVRAEEHLTAVGADGPVATALGVAEGTPLLSNERVAYTYGDKPMEWRLGLCLTTAHHYVNLLD